MAEVRRPFPSFRLVLAVAVIGIQCFICTQGVTLKTFPLLMPNVRPEKDETYLCMSVKIDEATEFYITAFEPSATMNTAHHMLLYVCTEPGSTGGAYNCGGMNAIQPGIPIAPTCKWSSRIIYAWARNAPKLVLPEGVAFNIGGKSGMNYLVLQVHYASVEAFKDGLTDNSGVFLHYTKTPQPRNAGILVMGTVGRILPNAVEYMETACTIYEDKVMHPFAFRTHTHSLGRVVAGYKVTPEDGNMTWTLIGKKDPQLPQMFYPVANKMTISKGDMLAARCTMESNRDRVTMVGPTNEDEMCNFYIMYWVEGPLFNQGECFTMGPPTYYWSGQNMKDIPNDEASSLPVGESAQELGYHEAAF